MSNLLSISERIFEKRYKEFYQPQPKKKERLTGI